MFVNKFFYVWLFAVYNVFELAMRGRYGVANERIINSLKESIKKNDVFEKVKIDKIYKDDLKNQASIALHIVKQFISDRSWYARIVNNILYFSYKSHHFIYRTVFNDSAVSAFYFYVLSSKFKAGLLYFYTGYQLQEREPV
jgi:hypothetical protein